MSIVVNLSPDAALEEDIVIKMATKRLIDDTLFRSRAALDYFDDWS